MHPLAAMLAKRASPVAAASKSTEGDAADPPARHPLAAMLEKRASPSKEGAPAAAAAAAAARREPKKNALSAMLAGRAPVTPQAKEKGGEPALKDDPKYEKYLKMLKVGMPLPVVQHAMTRDGFDPKIMEGDHNLPAASPIPAGGVPLKQDPAYAKYFKMLKLGLPLGAVKNAMERDGLDPSVMDGDHDAPAPGSKSPAGDSSAKKREKDTHRRTRLHWDTSGIQLNPNSVWAQLQEDKDLEGIEIDEQEFAGLFQAEINRAAPSSGGGVGINPSTRSVVQVIDPKRANNGGIILARLRMSYDDMAKAVERIDETAMTANQAQGIIEYMPTLVERNSLRDYMKAGNGESAAKFERLCECEKFMVAMMTVTQSKRKIRALLFKLQFRGCIHDLAHDVFSIEKACDELSNSVRLRKIFGIVLNIGNRLNTAGPGEKRKAGAFTIKSLLKLNQAKAFDNKTTFLHYVVLVVHRNSEELLDFKEDLPTVPKAGKIFWDQCVSELEEVETQLENVRKLALHEAKSNKIVYALPNKPKSSSKDVDSDDLSVESMSLEDEVALLRSTKIGMFALSAIRKVSQLRERVDTAKDKFSSLLEYFGESEDSRMQPHELFEIITTFCRTFDEARKAVDKIEKAKKRDESKKDKDESKVAIRSRGDVPTQNEKLKSIQENRTPVKKNTYARPPQNRPIPRASSLQPNMGNVLSDLKRATSAKWNSSAAPSSNEFDNNLTVALRRHPTDEISPDTSNEENSDEVPPASSAAPPSMPKRAVPPPQNSITVFCAKAKAEQEEAEACEQAAQRESRARAEAAEAEARERRLAKAEAARIAMRKRQLADEAAAAAEAERIAAQEELRAKEAEREKQRAEEAATAEADRVAMEEELLAEQARIATKEKQLAEEAAAAEAERRRTQEQQQQSEQAESTPSYETEVNGPTGRGSENSATAANGRDLSPKRGTAMTRRDIIANRRERARHRHLRGMSPTKTATPTARPPTAATPTAATPTARASVAGTPKARTPMAAAPRARTPMAPSPTARTPMARTPIARTPVAGTPKSRAPTASTPARPPASPAQPPCQEELKPRATSPRPGPSSNASARAAARNRYARHRRMHQQSQGT